MTGEIKILVADDDAQMQLAIKASLERAGYDVTVVGNGRLALEQLERESYNLLITDQRMPEMDGSELLAVVQSRGFAVPVVMITAHGTINQAVEAMQAGAADFITKPFSIEDLERIVEKVLSHDPVEATSQGKAQKKNGKSRAIITNDPLMIRVLEVAEAVAKSDATILVQGESGTGKELIARLVHSASRRANHLFVAVNCAALPDTLLESELFGHEKGAFTGAQARKIGKFEMANGGTILLDEISEMDLGLQAKLLRVLQEREVDRVGGTNPIPIDVRVIATTNRNLEEEAKAGKFRSDLYYRLNVIPLTLPPLRARKGDIRLLAHHFIRQFLGKDMDIPENVMMALENAAWPGNIRELQNAIERGAILCRGGTPKESDFLLGVATKSDDAKNSLSQRIEIIREPSEGGDNASQETDIVLVDTDAKGYPTLIRSGLTVHEVERALILETLKACNENRTQAAKLLGISIRTLRNKLSEYNSASRAE